MGINLDQAAINEAAAQRGIRDHRELLAYLNLESLDPVSLEIVATVSHALELPVSRFVALSDEGKWLSPSLIKPPTFRH